MANSETFLQMLNNGPAILFLGQDYLRAETGTDPLLAQMVSHFGAPEPPRKYDLLWTGLKGQSSDTLVTWMSERCRRLSPPQWLKSVSSFAWNGVVSSAIDPIWLSAFRNDWRDVAPIYDDEYFPLHPRNRQELHCTFLFGSLNQSEPKQKPPLSELEYFTRRTMAGNLIQRLPDVLSPLGVLAIEGYDWERDWLSLQDFYGTLHLLGQGQIHYFSAKDEETNHPILADLIQNGKMVIHSETLEQVLEHASSRGFIKLGPARRLGRCRQRCYPANWFYLNSERLAE